MPFCYFWNFAFSKQIQCKGELMQKVMNIYKYLANSKVIALKQY